MPVIPSIDEVIYAYTQGYFPMAHPEEDNQIYWHKPKKRGILPLEKVHFSKNLLRLYRKAKFDLFIDKDFRQTIEKCAERESTWISAEIIDLYCELHNLGYAHSYEAWYEGNLVGGLYGVEIGNAFFGESMFHTVTDASKIALAFLVKNLIRRNFLLLDTQYLNDHLIQFGGIEIPDTEYEALLQQALSGTGIFSTKNAD